MYVFLQQDHGTTVVQSNSRHRVAANPHKGYTKVYQIKIGNERFMGVFVELEQQSAPFAISLDETKHCR